jgi:hypothetical protein
MFNRLWSWINKSGKQPPPPETQPPVISVFIAMNAPKLPSAEKVLANIATIFPTGPRPGTPSIDETKIVLPMSDGTKVVVIMMPLPMPWEELESRCEVSPWPEAAHTLRDHQAHLIVIVLGLRGQPVERHIATTRIAAAVAAAAPAIGVIWNGFLVHSPRVFQEQAAEVSITEPVPQLWIGTRVNDNSDGSFTFLTAGMDAFGLMEVEIESRNGSEQLADFGLGVVKYLLKQGVVVPEGQTVGRTDRERIPVVHGPGRWIPGTVMKLSI